jgi:multiple sugar transport system ATP-binding protein
MLHIETVLDRYPAKLSGGQRQRVACARALAVEPPVLLMDEPLSNLDALLRLEMRAELKAVLRAAGTTTIYVTHDQTEAMGLADRIALMHDGVIEQIDVPMQLYRRPKTRFVGGFVGSPPMNFVTVQVTGGQARIGALTLPAPIRDGTLLAGMRAEDIVISDAGQGIPLDVSVAEPLGAHTLTLSRLVWMDPVSGKALEVPHE